MLPHYAHVLHAAKPAVGLLTAAYPAGIVPGSLLGAWIAHRAGVRRTSLIGLLLFAASIAGFGFGTDIVTLDALRFVQGTGCGFIWGGGLTWVIAVAPRERRGAVLGSVFAAAIFGTLLGPVLGTLAVTVGTRPVFAVVGVVSLALAAWTLRHDEPAPWSTGPETDTPLRTAMRSRRMQLGSWLILLEAATIGATGTLLPLRLARFGASGIMIGATFLLASLVSDARDTQVVNVRNAGTMPFLPDDAVIEVPAAISTKTKAAVTTKAMTWFLVAADTAAPIARMAPAISQLAR